MHVTQPVVDNPISNLKMTIESNVHLFSIHWDVMIIIYAKPITVVIVKLIKAENLIAKYTPYLSIFNSKDQAFPRLT